jgi:hypothetical protein
MTAAREQIFALVDQLLGLDAEDPIAGLGEYEFEPDRDPAKFPALHAFDGGDLPLEEETGVRMKALTLTIEGFVQKPGGAAARAALNELHAEAVRRLMNNPALERWGIRETGPLRIDTAELANKRRRGFSQDFEITYSTVPGDPGAFA